MAAAVLRLLAIGAVVGVLLGVFACGVLSGGNAAAWFYVMFGCYGAAVGVVGSMVGGVVIALMRLATRPAGDSLATSKRT
jgi:hypothetical protein